jgi:hypothetical protein
VRARRGLQAPAAGRRAAGVVGAALAGNIVDVERCAEAASPQTLVCNGKPLVAVPPPAAGSAGTPGGAAAPAAAADMASDDQLFDDEWEYDYFMAAPAGAEDAAHSAADTVGLGRIVALYCRSSTSYHMC